ncbi:MAG: hypothetical protein L0Z53_25000 [Acidobacteriales bacterium]|nr:hypothetical protein [Terriglobales bacterium]
MRTANMFVCVVLFATTVAAQEPAHQSQELSPEAREQMVLDSVGLPVYPGARKVIDDKSKRPVTISDISRANLTDYQTDDSTERVVEFYKRELARYGQVLECRSGKPTNPSTLRMGLQCDRKQNRHSVVLKSGSKRNLYGVVVNSRGKRTSFTLIHALSSKDVGL